MKVLTIIVLLCAAVWSASAQEVTPEAAPEAMETPLTLYSHPTQRYHVVIPSGWLDFSTPEHVIMEYGMTNVFARASAAPDMESALAEAIAIFLPGLEGVTPSSTETLTLPNGVWTRVLYPMFEAGALTAYVQSYEGMHYVLMMRSGAGALPVIVPLDDPRSETALADGAWAAVEVVGNDPIPTLTTEQPVMLLGQTYTPFAFTSATGDLTAWTRIVGSSAYGLIVPSGETPDEAVFFTILLDFFLTPDTTSYLGLGIGAVVVIMGALIASFIMRARNLRKDMATLQAIERG